MIIRNEELKAACQKVLYALDSNELSNLTDTLELKTVDNFLYMSITNREYFVNIRFDIRENIDLHATVNANLFLKLINQITSDTVEIICDDTNLIIRANGRYVLPMIYDNDKLLELPAISVNNVTSTFDIDSKILNSIFTYNSKELNKGVAATAVQKLYYMDNEGAITFTTGACVNKFELANPVKILLNNRLVRLFKLFKDVPVKFTLGYDAVSDDIIQTKVMFESNDISITAILNSSDSLIQSVPITAIRNRAFQEYPYSIVLHKDDLINSINRLMLFTDAYCTNGIFEFSKDSVTIFDNKKNNQESLYYNNDNSGITDMYTAMLDLSDLKTTLDNCVDSYVTIRFGNEQCIDIVRGNIYNIVPEVHSN